MCEQLLQGPVPTCCDQVASSDLSWVKSCFLASVALDFLLVHPHLGNVEVLFGYSVNVVFGGRITAPFCLHCPSSELL